MHTVVVTRELAYERPDLVEAVYKGFLVAKDQMASHYVTGMTFNNMDVMIPGLTRLIGEDRELLGADWWPYASAPTALRPKPCCAKITNRG